MKVNELATFEMSFNIKDSSTFYDNKFSIKIDDMQMLVDGAAFKDSKGDNACYLPVFGPKN